jgi:hypothetical protein
MASDCVACDKPVSPVEGAMSSSKVGPIHTSCVQARARTAQSKGKCQCRGERRAGEVKAPHGNRGRKFIPCLRCLGVIRQVG